MEDSPHMIDVFRRRWMPTFAGSLSSAVFLFGLCGALQISSPVSGLPTMTVMGWFRRCALKDGLAVSGSVGWAYQKALKITV